jgi:hypothetical protein
MQLMHLSPGLCVQSQSIFCGTNLALAVLAVASAEPASAASLATAIFWQFRHFALSPCVQRAERVVVGGVVATLVDEDAACDFCFDFRNNMSPCLMPSSPSVFCSARSPCHAVASVPSRDRIWSSGKIFKIDAI